ncbi:MAG: hemolysin family protein [Hyphomicrobiales bacterium]|nr:hemolysin family protein [Hyphomicrobiales bacterium]MDE2114156.1 HlyC/CorC family transporter [Hyphomicrobiales bacterium]
MSSEPPNPSQPPKPGLMERLRELLGMGAPSIRDDIEDALDDQSTLSDFSPQERVMLKNVLGLHEVRVADVMVPRADIIAVAMDSTLVEVLATFRTAGHSRLPVHGETLDDPRGMVHIRDFVDYIAAATEAATGPRRRKAGGAHSDIANIASLGGLDLTLPLSAANILRPVLFVPPSMPALDLLVKMQAMRTHMALVIDEYGGTDGLASIEDIVEVIVGDIEDEHDEVEGATVSRLNDGSYLADARAGLEEVSRITELPMQEWSDLEDVDTLGGHITTLAGRVPLRGEIIRAENGIEFEILDADPRRLKKIKIRLPQKQPDSDTSTKGAASGPVSAEPTGNPPADTSGSAP